jgi:hypothetical protein
LGAAKKAQNVALVAGTQQTLSNLYFLWISMVQETGLAGVRKYKKPLLHFTLKNKACLSNLSVSSLTKKKL